jgi:N-acylneuraminate cytidylyltransferase
LAVFTPYKMWRPGDDGFLVPLLTLDGMPDPYNMPRNILPTVLQQDGYVDITRPRTIFEQGTTTGRRILPFPVDDEPVVDIDFPSEMEEAERLLIKHTKAD